MGVDRRVAMVMVRTAVAGGGQLQGHDPKSVATGPFSTQGALLMKVGGWFSTAARYLISGYSWRVHRAAARVAYRKGRRRSASVRRQEAGPPRTVRKAGPR